MFDPKRSFDDLRFVSDKSREAITSIENGTMKTRNSQEVGRHTGTMVRGVSTAIRGAIAIAKYGEELTQVTEPKASAA